MKTVTYKGYQCSVEFDDSALYIKVLHIDDLLVAKCNSASEVKQTAIDLVDAYLEDCRDLGREPAKPFKGSFNVRIDPEQHRGAAMAASEAGLSLNSWVATAIREKLECARLEERVDSVFAVKKEELFMLQHIQVQSTAEWRRQILTHHMHHQMQHTPRSSDHIATAFPDSPWRPITNG